MEGTIASITLFASSFEPRNWAYCAGQLLAVQSNTALFSLLGATYGGDGRTTFGLPDLRGRVAVGAGSGAGLDTYTLGEKTGAETNTLLLSNMPAHTHQVISSVQMPVNGDTSDTDSPAGAYPATGTSNIYQTAATAGQFAGAMNTTATIMPAGAGVPMSNMQPYLGMNYIICMYGIFPSRN